MTKLKRRNIRYKVSFISIILIIGVIMINYRINPYNVSVNEYGDHGMQAQTKDKVAFALAIIKAYHRNMQNEVHKKFYDKFPLASEFSALFVVSSYGESLLFLYPSDKKEILINYVDVPAQVMVSHGLIDLNNPIARILPEHIKVNIPKQQAVKEYESIHCFLQVEGGNGRDSAYMTGEGEGAVVFTDPLKLVEFVGRDSFFTFYGGKLTINTSDPITLSIYKKPMKFDYSLKGPLVMTNVINFAGLSDIAERIGNTLFYKDLKELIVKSESFKYFMAHKKIKPIAEEIALKKKRSEEDKSYDYPLWMFKEDLMRLQELAINEGVSKEYVNELVGMMKANSLSGTLLFYYRDQNDFILQWLLINASLLILMILISLIKFADTPLIQLFMNELSIVKADKYLLLAVIVAINGWVFAVKPAHLDIRYWLIPAVLFFINVAISVYIQKNIIQ